MLFDVIEKDGRAYLFLYQVVKAVGLRSRNAKVERHLTRRPKYHLHKGKHVRIILPEEVKNLAEDEEFMRVCPGLMEICRELKKRDEDCQARWKKATQVLWESGIFRDFPAPEPEPEEEPEQFDSDGQTFAFRGHNIRTLLRNGEPWFVAKDVCEVLELGNVTRALDGLEEDEKMTLTNSKSHSGQRGGAQFLNIVNESGLYALIFKSRKPEAKAFRRWVTSEVLPTLRRTGRYETKAPAPEPIPEPTREPAAPEPKKKTWGKRNMSAADLVAEFETWKSFALSCGKSEQEALLSADGVLERDYGISLLSVAGIGMQDRMQESEKTQEENHENRNSNTGESGARCSSRNVSGGTGKGCCKCLGPEYQGGCAAGNHTQTEGQTSYGQGNMHD